MQNFNASGEPSGAGVVGNGQIQNELVDKEVEQVIMKSSSNKGPAQQKLGGYALPGDEEDDDNGALIGQVNLDDQEEDKAQDSDEDAELD